MLIGSYSPSLVVISLFVAILASYTALDHTPTPIANAPPVIHTYTARPLAVARRPARSSAV